MQIRPLSLEDKSLFPDALEILNRLQGRDIFPPRYLYDRTSDEKSLVVGAFYEDRLVGVAVAQVLERFDYYTSFGMDLVQDFENHRVGTLMTMSVHEDFQGLGVGQTMSRARLDWLKNKNCNVIIGVSWVSGFRHTSNRVFEKLGFSAVTRHDLFYEKVSRERGFVCPACGDPPCQCPAILYRLDL